jgi:type VI secretion system protein ImpH
VQNVVGLVGATGTMPHAFSELVQSSVRGRNAGLRAFLDLFNDRLAALLYDAFAKYRIEIEAERAPLTRASAIDDLIRSLSGLSERSLQGRLGTPDAAVLHHTGLLSRHARSAHAVERTLSSALGQTVRVEQFVGEWLPIALAERSRLPTGRDPAATFCQLGRDAVVGRRVWSVQGCVRLDIGPMDYATFQGFLPGEERDAKLRGMASFALGADTAFGLRLRLCAAEVPALRLGGSHTATGANRLGWNSWIASAGPRTRPGIVELPTTSALNSHRRTVT